MSDEDEIEIPLPKKRFRQRSLRRRMARAKTIQTKHLTRAVIRVGRELYPPIDNVEEDRPRTRGDCEQGMRPCPWVACKHHLYLDINPGTGTIKINFPELEPWELASTCTLDVADNGSVTLEATGELMNVTRERTRQIEVRALLKLAGSGIFHELGIRS